MSLVIKNEQDAWKALEELSKSNDTSELDELRFEGWPILHIGRRSNEHLQGNLIIGPDESLSGETTTPMSKLHVDLQTDLNRLAAMVLHGKPNARYLEEPVKAAMQVRWVPCDGVLSFDLAAPLSALARYSRQIRRQSSFAKSLIVVALALGSAAGVLAWIGGLDEVPEITAELSGKASVKAGGVQAQFDFGLKGTIEPVTKRKVVQLQREAARSEVTGLVYDRFQWWSKAMQLAPQDGYIAINGVELHARSAHGLARRHDGWQAEVRQASSDWKTRTLVADQSKT